MTVLTLVVSFAQPRRTAEAQVAAVNVCGNLEAFTAATATAPGSIRIGGQTYAIAVGNTLSGQGLAVVGANLCLASTLNLGGQLVGGTLTANTSASATANVCGTVNAYTAATAIAPGSIRIGTQTFPIAVGTTLAGQGLAAVGANLCLAGTLNAAGQLSGGTLTTNTSASTAANLCGRVDAYTAATATAPGSITVGGQTFQIAAGTNLTGQGLAAVGANLCLAGTVNTAGQLTSGGLTTNTSSTPTATPSATATATATVAPTASATAVVTGSPTVQPTVATQVVLQFPTATFTTPQTVTVISGGVPCGTVQITGTSQASFTLPAACAVPNRTVTFTGGSGQTLPQTVTIPPAGGTLVVGAPAPAAGTAAGTTTQTAPAPPKTGSAGLVGGGGGELGTIALGIAAMLSVSAAFLTRRYSR